MRFTDTHCHVFKEYYEDVSKVVNDSKSMGVDRLINNACDRKSCAEVLETAKEFDGVYAAIGIHPEVVDSYKDEDVKFVMAHVNDEDVVAIGEIGLDYHYTKENKDKQIELFRAMLDIAKNSNKPVIVHSRDAWEDTIKVLKDYNLKGVIHAFSGSLELAKTFIKMGYVLGIGGVITFKNCKLKDVVKEIDLRHIILETDSPYLAPVPYRGCENYPGLMVETAKYLCELKGISMDELAKITNDNIKRIFDK